MGRHGVVQSGVSAAVVAEPRWVIAALPPPRRFPRIPFKSPAKAADNQRMGESHYLKAKAAGLPDFPPGLVPRYEAAQMFGVALGTWEQWEKSGRVSITRHKKKLSKGPPWVLYSVEDLKRLLEELKSAPAPAIPEGFVTREQAAAMFGISLTTWCQWERQRRIEIKRHSAQSGVGPAWVVYRHEDVQRPLDEYKNRPAPTFSPGLLTR